MEAERVLVAGGGLAGCEAAWQIARRGIAVDLWEMRPQLMTPAHQTDGLAELVCSNSLGSDRTESAGGQLKAELRELGSLLLALAEKARVPAGKALAVDRRRFSDAAGAELAANPLIRVRREELTGIPRSGPVVIATGPLTSDRLAASIAELTGGGRLFFYDAVAPIVAAESVDPERSFWASRYAAGGDDYLNCPLTVMEYEALWRALIEGEQHEVHAFDKTVFFEGCLPIEEMARRGRDTLRYGPLKPVGLLDPRTGHRPYAVVQLRREDEQGALLNLVGFQTNLTFGAQREAIRLIPALREADIVRYGVMHRNTYLNGPAVLEATLESRVRPGLYFAGQITGVEGYTESIATGLLAGINAARRVRGEPAAVPPPETVCGSLVRYVSSAPTSDFQPMNANWGLLPRLQDKTKRRDRPARHAARATEAIKVFAAFVG